MTMLRAALGRTAPRALLAVLLGFGAEGLLWAGSSQRDGYEAALAVAGYLALAMLSLDLMTRWRVRDLYGLAAVGGMVALTYSALFNPSVTLREMPLSVLTDVLGGQALIAMAMLLLFCMVAGVARRWAWLAVPVSALIGAAWGVWLRWSPELGGWAALPTTRETVLWLGGGFAVAVLGLAVLTRLSAPIARPHLELGAYEWLFVGGVVIIALYRQFDQRTIDSPTYLALSGLALVCLAMLWYRKDSYFAWVTTPWQPRPAWLPLLASLAVLVLAAYDSYAQPQAIVAGLPMFQFIRLMFSIVALLWLPGVVLLIGLRAVIRDIQAKPL
ncbi:MAG: hypothetical protein MUC99_01715 [Anaerolineae bacterium]|nr:hypothetical protein [Anaerolineae bacterium]